ncbi:MAG: methylmalonyl-CoA mutase [Nitrososphaeria archaeon]|nr:methylmalonyl-CoA mutase [Nitrososphaeria archaeon]
MFSLDDKAEIEDQIRDWEINRLKPTLERNPSRQEEFKTREGEIPIKWLYTPLDLKGQYVENLGMPGEYPYTRGIYPSMYRGRIWTIRQYAGYGSPEETNRLFKNLLSWGQTGLSLAFDLPTQCGYGSDHPLSEGEVGKVGVAVNTLRDLEVIFDGIPLDRVSTSFTINAPTQIILAMYLVLAERQGVPAESLRGTVQNDILKEICTRHTWIVDLDSSLKLTIDVIEYCSRYLPRFNPISITGSHYRESGASLITEPSLMFADAIEYVEKTKERGLSVDDFAARFSFGLCSHMGFFEEVAKLRASRRIWARIMRDRFDAEKPSTWRFRTYASAGGSVYTDIYPELNLVRAALIGMACALGGVQSIRLSTMDEAYGIPSEKTQRLSVMTQALLAEEAGLADIIDPLAGSYFVEWLTDEVEERVWKVLEQIEAKGGAAECIKNGYFQRRIIEDAYSYQRKIEEGEMKIIGINAMRGEERHEMETYKPDPDLRKRTIEKLEKVKRSRDQHKVDEQLERLRRAAEANENLMPYMINAVKAYATVGEICDVLREIYGEYRPPDIF